MDKMELRNSSCFNTKKKQMKENISINTIKSWIYNE
jgi:hypothetical protein